MTVGKHHANVDVGDSAQLLYNSRRNKWKPHTYTEVIRGKTRDGKMIENTEDHWRGERSSYGEKTGLPIVCPTYAERMIYLTVGGGRIKQWKEQFPVLVGMAREQVKKDEVEGISKAGHSTLRNFHQALLVEAKQSHEDSIITGPQTTDVQLKI